MTPTSLNENSLELTIMSVMTGVPIADFKQMGVRQVPAQYDAEWLVGNAHDYDRTYGIDIPQLVAFLTATQPKIVEDFELEKEGSARAAFLQRLSNQIAKDGVITVLRKGFSHNQHRNIQLYYPTPTAGNTQSAQLFNANRFIVTRQLRYSTLETARSLDLAVFLNGLPIFTFELKNTITSQTVNDAMQQYRLDRPVSERLFKHGICIAHFALDDQEVHFTTKLAGKATIFLPFNKGHNDAGGNPPNPAGIKTDYLWKEVFRRQTLATILESFVQQFEEKDPDTGKKSRKIVFPRYHQLDAVRLLVNHAHTDGVGHRYLIQHSAGSGKSNTIAWLAQQLIELTVDSNPQFNSIIVVTDRRALDTQLSRTIKAMFSSDWMIGHAESSDELRQLISQGKRVITTTVQKFPFILDKMGTEHRNNTFALIIDEAHSSQGGRVSGKMNEALRAAADNDEEISFEDQILQAMEGRKMLPNASYFAFTATPKQKTLELFGTRRPDGQFYPFHTYTMKQAIDEGFILDVLRNYTPYRSYYHVVKKIEDDPEFDSTRARKAIRRYVETNPSTIERKAQIIVDHFMDQKYKLDNKARAMVATQSIDAAIKYWQAINVELAARNWPWRTIVAFTGERDVHGVRSTESTLNEFSSREIPSKLKEEPYRMLIVADKYLTGFDEPLLQTMYVDKILSDVKAVQALSRLNRAYPGKKETFVLDFANEPDRIVSAFQPYYRTTVLSHETDPNKLYDLQDTLDGSDVYLPDQVFTFVERYLANVERPLLDTMLDRSVEKYQELDEDGQVEFKSNAKAFVRSYNFLSQILPWTNPDWERLSIFLTFLTPRLPAPKPGDDSDITREILEAIDLDSYRSEKQGERDLILEDEDGIVEPRNPENEGRVWEPEKERLSAILESFNAMFADMKDPDGSAKTVRELIEGPMARDERLVEFLRNSSEQNTFIEFKKAAEAQLNANFGIYTDILMKMGTDHEFGNNLYPMLFKLWQATIAAGD